MLHRRQQSEQRPDQYLDLRQQVPIPNTKSEISCSRFRRFYPILCYLCFLLCKCSQPKGTQPLLTTDEHKFTQIEFLHASVSICAYLWLNWFICFCAFSCFLWPIASEFPAGKTHPRKHGYRPVADRRRLGDPWCMNPKLRTIVFLLFLTVETLIAAGCANTGRGLQKDYQRNEDKVEDAVKH